MDLVSVKRWQWLALGVLAGLLLWGVRRWSASDLARFGDTLNDPVTFEQALTKKVVGDVPRFKDIRVHRQTLRDPAGGTSKTVDIVAGKYCDGEPGPGGAYVYR